MTPRTATRGVTLIELLVGMTVVVLAVSMASVAMISQNRALQALDLTRTSNENGRDATLLVEGSLRQLGWGVDPRHAIDLRANCPPSPAKCRDRINAPDELAFVARNPLYQWRDVGEAGCATAGGCFSGNAWSVSAVDLVASPRTVSIVLRKGQVLERGRVMLVTCQGGNGAVMVTLSGSHVGNDTPVTLTPLAAAAAPYNEPASLTTCHGEVGASVFMVDRYRYFIGLQGGVSWLMLDPGIDLNDNGTLPPTDAADLIPVARDVEDLQVAYVLQPSVSVTAPDSNRDWIIGNDGALGAAEEPDASAAAPLYTTSETDASRFSKHPANVRAIRLSFVLRSERTDSGQAASWTGDSLVAAENRAGTLSGGRFRRSFARTQVTLRNMAATGPFIY